MIQLFREIPDLYGGFGMSKDDFFQKPAHQSRVKAELVEKYFAAWANILKQSVLSNNGRIAYIDLFAGPGRYEDGAASVPLKILEKAVSDDFLREHLVTVFNDKDDNLTRTLETEIAKLPGIKKLKYRPEVLNEEVGEKIVKRFEEKTLVPTLFFVDPWGYKGLSWRLINSVLKDWGCDCIIFFNYNRINAGLDNPTVTERMDELFQSERAEKLRTKIKGLSPAKRETAIIQAVSEALAEMGGRHVLPFAFKKIDGSRTTHYLIFVSKNVRGYTVMKDIMARASSSHNEGVPSFTYSPADESTPLLFEFERPLTKLREMLLKQFAGQSLTMRQVYERHHVDRLFIKKNYKDALVRLEAEGRISADPPANDRRKPKGQPTFADDVVVNFPNRS